MVSRSAAQLWKSWRAWWQDLFTAEQWRILGVGIATLLGASYRLANLRDSMQFQADQGRDAIIAFEILQGNITLIGPSTSVGNMFLGPLYYYFMAPFILLAGKDPIGPSLAVAVIGVITVPLLYMVGKRLVGPWAAFLATLLYASAPAVIAYTRFSWNPNPAPIITLGVLYSIWGAWHGSARWWLGAVLGFLVLIQLHYVALLIAAPIGIFWIADIVRSYRSKQSARGKQLLVYIPVAVVMLVLSFLPLIIFNWRFDNLILKGFLDFLDGSSGDSPRSFGDILLLIPERAKLILFELWGVLNKPWLSQLNSILLGGYTLLMAAGWLVFRQTQYRLGYLILVVATLTSALGLCMYRGEVFYHYFSYFYPISYLLTGALLVVLVKVFRWPGIVLAAGLFVWINWLQVLPQQLYYLDDMGWRVDDMKRTSERILERIPEDKTYAMTTLSEIQDYRGLNYRYFLLTSDHPPISLEEFGSADLLVIIAENPTDPDLVLGSPVYEVVTFPKGEYSVYPPDGIGPHIYIVERK